MNAGNITLGEKNAPMVTPETIREALANAGFKPLSYGSITIPQDRPTDRYRDGGEPGDIRRLNLRNLPQRKNK